MESEAKRYRGISCPARDKFYDLIQDDAEFRHLVTEAPKPKNMPWREWDILKGFYFGGETYCVLGKRHGVSGMRANELANRAVRKLKWRASGLRQREQEK